MSENHCNYRVVRHGDGKLGYEFSIRGVHYEDGKPISWTLRGVPPCGETFEELTHDIEKMLLALDKPVLVECPGTLTLKELNRGISHSSCSEQ